MAHELLPLSLLALIGCLAPAAPGDGGRPTTATVDTGVEAGCADPEALVEEELDGLASWTPHRVPLVMVAGEPPVDGDQLSLLVKDPLGRIELTTSTRAQDHNSSRSNKTASVAVSDPLDDVPLSWDGQARCAALPCPSLGRPAGASSLLALDLDAALDDGAFGLSWAETFPSSATFEGSVSVELVDHRGHVTVLKASSTDGGDVVITSALAIEELSVSDGDEPVYVARPTGSPLATVAGATGTSWPTGLWVEETPTGTVVSFTW